MTRVQFRLQSSCCHERIAKTMMVALAHVSCAMGVNR